MSFFKTSDNKAVDTSGKFESGGGNFEPMPEGTSVLAAPVEAGWKSYEGEDYINIQWQVLAPTEYRNRRIFQKIKVYEPTAAKADKAKRMLAAIDTNAGGKLMALDKTPDDADLTQSLVGKQMMLRLGLWEIDDKRGNWVQAVAPKTAQTPAPAQTPAAAQTEALIDEDIPF
jgi:hypothetical protein